MSAYQQQTLHQRTLGIIGGMSWESTQSYYRLINEGVKEKLDGLHSADLLTRYSVLSSLEPKAFINNA